MILEVGMFIYVKNKNKTTRVARITGDNFIVLIEGEFQSVHYKQIGKVFFLHKNDIHENIEYDVVYKKK